MFFNVLKFFKITALVVFCTAVVSSNTFAQADVDGLPPQPAQSSFPEVDELEMMEPEIVEAEVIEEVVDEPLATLDEPVEQPDVPEQPEQVTQPTPVPHSGTYYDSDSIGPSSLGASAGPRKVDPKYEAGSSFVVVKKNAGSNSRQAKVVAAQRALKLGRYNAALELYEQLYKKNPRDSQIVMGLAVAQQYNGFTESAIATYEELLKRNPNHTGAMINLMGLLEQHQPRVAYNKLQKMWNKNGQNPAIAAQLGLVSANLGDHESASRYLGIAASLEPNNALHYYNLAIVFDKAQSHQSAIDYYQKALEVDATNKSANNIPRDQVYDRLADLRRL